jgi:hypothetical protein
MICARVDDGTTIVNINPVAHVTVTTIPTIVCNDGQRDRVLLDVPGAFRLFRRRPSMSPWPTSPHYR